MKFWKDHLIALLLAPGLCALGQSGSTLEPMLTNSTVLQGSANTAITDFSFDSIFTDSMVLQKGANTMISGQGPPPKSADISFNDTIIVKKIKPDSTGKWSARLDLQNVSSSGTLKISWGKGFFTPASERTLTNITIGDIWLVAGWEDQGVTGRWTEDISDSSKKPGHVRFWDLRRVDLRRIGTDRPHWEDWPVGEDVELFPDIVLRLAVLFENRGYVGIVLLPRSILEKALTDPTRKFGDSVFVSSMPENLAYLTKGVADAQKSRNQELISNKHAGVVADIASITNYQTPVFVPFEAFSSKEFPAQLFTFKGVVWPTNAAAGDSQSAPPPP
jgi:hypothetical protein